MHPELDARLKAGLEELRAGGLVIFPTETFYGIAADTECAAALDRLSALKQRELSSPFGLIAGDADSAFGLTSEVSPLARAFARAFWPGPLTIVMPARDGLHPAIVGPNGVGVRVSPHPLARRLAQGLGRPITATSANLKGQPPVTTADELEPLLRNEIKVILKDTASLRGGNASTVIEIVGDSYRMVRAGAVNQTDLELVARGTKN
jgi:L-threonylcarbamoyladenylate synthase